ncbi:unnamed protein product, partial [Didymodactylos carnosus]
MRYCVTCKET